MGIGDGREECFDFLFGKPFRQESVNGIVEVEEVYLLVLGCLVEEVVETLVEVTEVVLDAVYKLLIYQPTLVELM